MVEKEMLSILCKQINNKADAIGYDHYCYKQRIMNCKEVMTDANVLFESYLVARKASWWKKETMKCDLNYLTAISKEKQDMESQVFSEREQRKFFINERGRCRQVTSTSIESKIMRHALCDYILQPYLTDYIMYNSGASLKGKGVDFQRKRFELDLHKFYRDNGSNNGYILLIDFSKYYDNILHKKLYEDVTDVIEDDFFCWLYYEILKSFRIDVSTLSDREIKYYRKHTINLLEYEKKKCKKLGKKYINKSINMGDQTSQLSGNFYPRPVDNYIKIVRGHKYAGRYCDDSYIICRSKERLKDTLEGIRKISDDYGIAINENKTKIVKLSSQYMFLKIRYSLTNTGKVIRKIDKKKITRTRRKLKKLKVMLDNGEVKFNKVEEYYKTFIRTNIKYLSRRQREEMDKLYNELFINDWRYDV